MNEYFELLHKGCNDLSIFFIDVLVFLMLVLIVYSIIVMIKYKIISNLIKAACEGKRAKAKREELKKKAMHGSHTGTKKSSYNTQRHPVVPDIPEIIDAVVVEVDDISRDDNQRWNDFNQRFR